MSDFPVAKRHTGVTIAGRMDEEFPVQGLEQRFESGPRVIRIPKKINLKKKEC